MQRAMKSVLAAAVVAVPWLAGAQAATPPVRDRSEETGSLLKAAFIAPCEILAAAALVRHESGGVEGDDLTRAIARLLGFQRVGSELSAVIAEVASR